MTIFFQLTQAQRATRVKLSVVGTDPVEVLVGNPAETWTTGCYIEVVRSSPNAAVYFTPYDPSVTLNLLSGTNQLLDGEYARVSLVSPGVWDLHVYPSVQRFASTLDSLSDVDAVAAQSGQALVFNGLMWAPASVAPTYVKPAPLRTVTTASTGLFLASAADHNSHYRCTASDPTTVVIQPDTYWTGTQMYWDNGFDPFDPGPMPDGGNVLFTKVGSGNINFVAAPGVTINTPDTLSISRPFGKATLVKVGANEWDLEGNIGA